VIDGWKLAVQLFDPVRALAPRRPHASWARLPWRTGIKGRRS
jgi:hypothetical protein